MSEHSHFKCSVFATYTTFTHTCVLTSPITPVICLYRSTFGMELSMFNCLEIWEWWTRPSTSYPGIFTKIPSWNAFMIVAWWMVWRSGSWTSATLDQSEPVLVSSHERHAEGRGVFIAQHADQLIVDFIIDAKAGLHHAAIAWTPPSKIP